MTTESAKWLQLCVDISQDNNSNAKRVLFISVLAESGREFNLIMPQASA